MNISKSQLSPVSLHERIEVLDVLRGLAICGILIGNMQWFSGYGMMPPAMAAQAPIADQITHFLVHFFIEGKFYSIFSFLFGFGFALQIARAEERGDLKASLFKRRLFWLLVIGLLHAWLLWAGDIVSIYAVMGFILVLFRKARTETLLKWAVILLAVPILWYILQWILFVAFVPADAIAQMQTAQANSWSDAVNTVTTSNYWQILTSYNRNYVVGRYLGLIFQMRLPKILAMFLFGLYAYRRGVFQDLQGNAPFIRKVLIYGLVVGIAGNAVFAWVSGSEAGFPPSLANLLGVITYAFSVPALALGIAALVVTLWQKNAWQRALALLAPVGRMALTNYIMQTVICVLLFYGYGFGYFGSFGALKATLTALAIFVFQILVSGLWLRYFAYGPLEWIWRQLTYKKKLAIWREQPAEDPAL